MNNKKISKEQQDKIKAKILEINNYIKQNVKIFDTMKFNIDPYYLSNSKVELLVFESGNCVVMLGKGDYNLFENIKKGYFIDSKYLLSSDNHYNIALNLIIAWEDIKKQLDLETKKINEINNILG
ncbi:MAG: hypothetical protein PHX70_14370 [Clostridium sp.]|nr:hypothetical protein [Clostridium sp.]